MTLFIGILHFGEDSLIYKLIESLDVNDNDCICILNHNPLDTLSFSNEHILTLHDPRNLGFATGMNFLMNKAIDLNYEQFIGLNNDMIVLEDSLDVLRNRAIKNIVVQGTMINEKRSILSCRNRLSQNFFWVNSIDRHAELTDITDMETDFICAGFFALDLENFKENPVFFDEDFFMYHEDIEWSNRLLNAGYEFQSITSALAIHHESSGTGGKISLLGIQYRWTSLLLLLKKNDQGPLYKFLSIILFIIRMTFVWTKYGFRIK